jgi:hypothetical protein
MPTIERRGECREEKIAWLHKRESSDLSSRLCPTQSAITTRCVRGTFLHFLISEPSWANSIVYSFDPYPTLRRTTHYGLQKSRGKREKNGVSIVLCLRLPHIRSIHHLCLHYCPLLAPVSNTAVRIKVFKENIRGMFEDFASKGSKHSFRIITHESTNVSEGFLSLTRCIE